MLGLVKSNVKETSAACSLKMGKRLERSLRSQFSFLFSAAIAVFHSRADLKASSASSGVLMTLCFAGECKLPELKYNPWIIFLAYDAQAHTHTHTFHFT